MTIQYDPYKKPEGVSRYLKLKELLTKEGDKIKLACLKGRKVLASENTFGTTQFEWEVLWKNPQTGEKEVKLLKVDAPDEKNDWQGSQVYQGMFDNNIQPKDIFYIAHGGKMRNQYRTTIYVVYKENSKPTPDVDMENIDKDYFEQAQSSNEPPEIDQRIEDIPL